MSFFDDLAAYFSGSSSAGQAAKDPVRAVNLVAPVPALSTEAAIAGGQQAGVFPGGGPAPNLTNSQVMGSTRTINPISISQAQGTKTIQQNDELIRQMQGTVGNVQGAREYATAYDQFALQNQQQLAGQTQGALAGASAQGYQNAGNANVAGQNYLNNLGGFYGGINAQNQADLGAYTSANDPYRQAVAPAQFVAAQRDPYGAQLQNNALGNFSGMMNGSMDISAAQAQAYQYQAAQYQAQQVANTAYADAVSYQAQYARSKPEDIQRQVDAELRLRDIGGGALNYQSQGARAAADQSTINRQDDVYNQLQSAASGSLDQASGAALARVGQGTLDQQQQGLNKLWGLTDPSITAQERMMMEQARREQESTENASRGAVMSDLQARGFGGSGAQQTSMLGQQEQLGQERTLADLGAQANAQARATNALGMYVDATGKLRSQEFDEAFARAAAGDAMAVSNANRRLQATGMAADQINNMRAQSFDEAYKKGIAADNAAANNQQTMLSGSLGAADQANRIRAANDQVDMFNANAGNEMNRFNAANQTNVNMFNAGQENQVNMFNVDQLNNVGMFNTHETNNASAQNAALKTQTSQFNAGETNRVGIANQQTRAQGAISYGTQANAIANSNDQMNMWNAGQQNYMNVSNQNLASNEARRITDLNQSELNEKQQVQGAYAAMGQSLTDSALRENDSTYYRNQTATDAAARNALGSYGVGMDLVGAYGAAGQNEYNRSLGTAQLSNDIGRTSIQNNLNNNQIVQQGQQMQMSEDAYKGALAQLSRGDDSLLSKTLGFRL